jgi:exodeoxyribonuclease VII large subunit
MPRKKRNTSSGEGLQSLFGSLPVEEPRPRTRKKSKPVVGAEPISLEKVFSVSEFLDYLNSILGEKKHLMIRGEVSEAKMYPSGTFFTLKDKDDEGVLNCYMNPRAYRSSGVTIEDGMEVKVTGVPNVYKPKGRLSLLVTELEPVGEGSLKRAYELLKKKLESEGLFSRKRPLPEFIQRIGIVTSRTGAVIGDFRKNLEALGFQIYFYDARVEGAKAVPEVIRGIRTLNTNVPDLDVLVLIRGGGSLEDLQAFNNEAVARELFASRVPTIAGIGHDRDVPIASLVADRQTSTPSIAALLVNESWRRLKEHLPREEQALYYAFERSLQTVSSSIQVTFRALTGHLEKIFLLAHHLESQLFMNVKRLQGEVVLTRRRMLEIGSSLFAPLAAWFQVIQEKLKTQAAYLEGVSPERNLKRGYSILMDDRGKVIREAREVSIGKRIKAKLYKGVFVSKVEEIIEDVAEE